MNKNKTEDTAVRPALFDRIFKPRTITLSNGHTVQQPVSRAPFIALLVVAVVLISARMTGFSFKTLIERGGQLGYILGRIFHPNWSYFRGFWVEADRANTMKLMNALTETIKKYSPQRVDHCYLALNRAFGLDGRKAARFAV